MKKFEHELGALKQQVMEMGDLAESMVTWASAALIERDAGVIPNVREAEPRLDQYQIAIDSEAVRLITVYAPIARDLRFLLMVIRINTELERIGDQALNNCEYAELLLSAPLANEEHVVSHGPRGYRCRVTARWPACCDGVNSARPLTPTACAR